MQLQGRRASFFPLHSTREQKSTMPQRRQQQQRRRQKGEWQRWLRTQHRQQHQQELQGGCNCSACCSTAMALSLWPLLPSVVAAAAAASRAPGLKRPPVPVCQKPRNVLRHQQQLRHLLRADRLRYGHPVVTGLLIQRRTRNSLCHDIRPCYGGVH